MRERDERIALLKRRAAEAPPAAAEGGKVAPAAAGAGGGAFSGDVYAELQEWILETQGALEAERASLLTRCHAAEHELEVLRHRMASGALRGV